MHINSSESYGWKDRLILVLLFSIIFTTTYAYIPDVYVDSSRYALFRYVNILTIGTLFILSYNSQLIFKRGFIRGFLFPTMAMLFLLTLFKFLGLNVDFAGIIVIINAFMAMCVGHETKLGVKYLRTLLMFFALKTNHGCGNHVICHDKRSLDIDSAKAKIEDGLSKVYNIYEPHYKHIKPMAFAEELIYDGTGCLPTDYKFMCVNGEPKCILVCSERGEKKIPTKATYDIRWNKLPWTQKSVDENFPKPTHLDEMIEVARKLSCDFEFVRVDLYDCPNKIYFSELTFSPAEGILSTFTTQALELMNPRLK